METDYEEIPFFKIPKYIKNFNTYLDEIAVEKRFCKAVYTNETSTRKHTNTRTTYLDANVYFINRDEQIIIVGWTFRGSQFLEIEHVYLYKNPKTFTQFILKIEDLTRNNVIRRLNNQPICTINVLPEFYLTSKYNNECSHLFTWDYISTIESLEAPKPRKFIDGTYLSN